MNDGMLLEAKIRSPKILKNLIIRESLLDEIETSDERLVIFHATTGFGKTVLMNAYGVMKSRNRTWYTLGSLDNDIVTFVQYLTAAIQVAWPDFAFAMPDMSGEGKENIDRCVDVFLKSLYTAFNAQEPRTLDIMLDDYQEITNERISLFLSRIIFQAPETVRFFMTTKGTLPQFIVRYLLTGEARIVSSEQLAFSQQEIEKLICAVREKRPVNDETGLSEKASLIYEYTEGWPAGAMFLCLYIRGKKGKLDRATVISACREFMVHDFIMYELFKKLPYDIQNFLVKTSPLEYMTAGLCREVTGERSPGNILDYLMAEGLFIQKQEGTTNSYRYHLLFRSFLSNQIAETERQEVLKKAAQFLMKTSQKEQAVAYAIAAGNRDLVSGAMERLGVTMLEEGKLETLGQWIAFLTEGSGEVSARAQIVIGMYEWRRDNRKEGKARLKQAFDQAREQGEEGTMAAACEALLDCLLTEGEFRQAGELLDEAFAAVGRHGSANWCLLTYWRGLICLIQGEEKTAAGLFGQLEHMEKAGGQTGLSPKAEAARSNSSRLLAILQESGQERLQKYLEEAEASAVAGNRVALLIRAICITKLLGDNSDMELDGNQQEVLESILRDERANAYRAKVCVYYGYYLCRKDGGWKRGVALLEEGVAMLSRLRLNLLDSSHQEPAMMICRIFAWLHGRRPETENGCCMAVCCFDDFKIVDLKSRQEVRFRTRKAQECMAYLIHIRGRRVTREEMMEVLWDADTAPEKEVTAFHNILSSIRKSLEPFGMKELLGYQDKRYFVDPSAIYTDIELMGMLTELIEARDVIRITNQEGILEMLAGMPYMKNVDGEWTLEKRSYYERVLLEGLLIDGRYQMERKDFAKAEEVLRKALSLSPYGDEVILTLMDCFVESGSQKGLEDCYREWIRIQRKDLEGWKQDAKMAAAYEQCLHRIRGKR